MCTGNGKDDILDTLRRTKDTRRSSADSGRLHFAKRFLAKGEDSASVEVPMEILFNYLGRMQQLERDDSLLQQTNISSNDEDTRATGDVGPHTARFALFEISAVVVHDKLQFSFLYNRRMKHGQEIRKWISKCQTTLEEIIEASARASPEPTLSDYPLLPLSYAQLAKLAKMTFPKAGVTHRDQVEDIYPCSPMQEGILLSQLRDPNAYFFHTILEVKQKVSDNRVDPKLMLIAWQRVVNRHQALRTVFVDSNYSGGTFDQLVVKNVDSGAKLIECGESEAIDKLNSIKLREVNRHRHPQLPHQLAICVTPTGRTIIKVEINHAVIDGGSTSIVLRDLAAAYEGRLPDDSGPLYSDYIRFIRSQSNDEDVKFWKRYLGGIHPCHLPRLNNQYTVPKRLSSTRMEFTRFAELQQLGENTGVTLANIMHTAWALVLRFYTGSDDVCFGYLSAGRDAPVSGIQDTVGAFINMLCCRMKFGPSSTISEIFHKVQNDYLESLPFQRCSLARVQHELGLSGKALYNTAISIQNHSRASDTAQDTITFEPHAAHDPSEVSIHMLSVLYYVLECTFSNAWL